MRTHITGLSLLAVCAAVLIVDTRWLLQGRRIEVVMLTGVFLVSVAVLGLLVALVPAVHRALTTD